MIGNEICRKAIEMIKYKKGYKYQLVEDYSLKVNIFPIKNITTQYIILDVWGFLTIFKGYCWDGASGAYDSKTIMRGSLIHDSLYQLMRMELLTNSYKEKADKLFKHICKEDGMSKFRTWYVYKAVRDFGKSSTDPKNKKKILTA